MKRLILLSLVLLTPWALDAAAQQHALRGDPGYLDLSTIGSWFEQEANVEVNVQGALLNLVVEASRQEDEELAEMLRKLKGVYVRVYNMEQEDVSQISARASRLAQSLRTKGWETVVKVREDEDHADIYIRSEGDRIAGLVVMVVEPEETVFVNVVGEIDPADIGRIGGRFNVPDIGRWSPDASGAGSRPAAATQTGEKR